MKSSKVEGDDAKDEMWQQICFPGSVQCIYKQLLVNKGHYFYRGTETTPPCDKDIDYLIMRYPIQIPQEQFEQLRQNVFMYRNDFIVKKNINEDYSELGRNEVFAGLIYRYVDKTPFDPKRYDELCKETEALRVFINNALKLRQNTQSMGG